MAAVGEDVAHIILFYKYFPPPQEGNDAVDNERWESLIDFQEQICKDCNLCGRVLVSYQGLNGTLSGRESDVEKYTAAVEGWTHKGSSYFESVDWKHSTAALGKEPFPDLQVRKVKELVASGNMPYDIERDGGKHLSPEEFHAVLEEAPEDLVVLDVRNRFEYAIGHFVDKSGRTAKDPNMRNFTQFKHYIDAVGPQMLDGKRVLMYCTGGIRCETASAYVRSKGLAKDVCQLSGGIHRYCEKYGDKGYFKGKNFVFDRRIAMSPPASEVADAGDGSAQSSDKVVGQCSECGKVFDELRGGVVCTACVCLVLVCSECTARGVPLYEGAGEELPRRREWYCKEHAYLRGEYFTFLDAFGVSELERQRERLGSTLLRVEEEDRLAAEKNPGRVPRGEEKKEEQAGRKGNKKKKKNTDPRQRALTLRRQIKRVEDRIALLQKEGAPPLANADALPCRCCRKAGCDGYCWGYWKAPSTALK
jgi:predicted sulfurtransferase